MADLYREYGMSMQVFINGAVKYGGMDAALLSEMKAMTEENKRLKRAYVESRMQNELLKEALGKSGKAPVAQGNGAVSSTG